MEYKDVDDEQMLSDRENSDNEREVTKPEKKEVQPQQAPSFASQAEEDEAVDSEDDYPKGDMLSHHKTALLTENEYNGILTCEKISFQVWRGQPSAVVSPSTKWWRPNARLFRTSATAHHNLRKSSSIYETALYEHKHV